MKIGFGGGLGGWGGGGGRPGTLVLDYESKGLVYNLTLVYRCVALIGWFVRKFAAVMDAFSIPALQCWVPFSRKFYPL